MTAEVEISVDGTPIACGTYTDCARMLGYSRKTLVSYKSTQAMKTPLVVTELPPLYDIDGVGEEMTLEEGCAALGCEPRALQVYSSDRSRNGCRRHWRKPWSLPPSEVQRLLWENDGRRRPCGRE